MNLPVVKDFFINKVTIQLKNGHKFEGLLSQINYKNQTVILEDVEDLGNITDRNFIPHDKKIVEKAFEEDNIEEIIFKDKHFCEPKKYNKDEFWDAISEPVPQQLIKNQKKQYGDRPHYQKKHYDNRDRNYDNKDNRDRNYDNRDRNYGNRDNRDRKYDNKERNYDNRQKNYENKQSRGSRRENYNNNQNRNNEQKNKDRDYR